MAVVALALLPAGGLAAAGPASVDAVVKPSGLFVFDGSKVGNSEVQCLVAAPGEVWCVLARADEASGTAMANTCGITETETFAAVFCRKGKKVPTPQVHRAEPPITRAPAWPIPKTKEPLLRVLRKGHALAIGGSHIICLNQDGRVVCAGYPRAAGVVSWTSFMSNDLVALARTVGGVMTKRGYFRSTHLA